MFCFPPVLKPDTPRKIHIEPENDALEDDFPFPGVYSQVPAVNLPGCTLSSKNSPGLVSFPGPLLRWDDLGGFWCQPEGRSAWAKDRLSYWLGALVKSVASQLQFFPRNKGYSRLYKRWHFLPHFLGGWNTKFYTRWWQLQMFVIFTLIPWGNDPIWWSNCSMGFGSTTN